MSGPRLFNLVVSNVPGPQQTFYLDGVPVREVFPAVPLNPRNQALTIGIVSYDGGVRFGLLADHDALPDVAEAAEGLERAVRELVTAATALGLGSRPCAERSCLLSVASSSPPSWRCWCSARGPRTAVAGEGLDTFENANFPFKFSYPDDFRAASAEGDVPALSLEGPNAITIQEIEPPVPESGLAAYVAQLLVEEGATRPSGRALGHRHAHRAHPARGGRPARRVAALLLLDPRRHVPARLPLRERLPPPDRPGLQPGHEDDRVRLGPRTALHVFGPMNSSILATSALRDT